MVPVRMSGVDALPVLKNGYIYKVTITGENASAISTVISEEVKIDF
jgi:hypothetical protein